MGQTLDYEVVDICVGGLDRTDKFLKDLAKMVEDYPDNLIPSENRGTDPVCTLPKLTQATESSTPDDPNSASRITTFAGFLSFLFLW